MTALADGYVPLTETKTWPTLRIAADHVTTEHPAC